MDGPIGSQWAKNLNTFSQGHREVFFDVNLKNFVKNIPFLIKDISKTRNVPKTILALSKNVLQFCAC